MYLSGHSNPTLLAMNDPRIGLMAQPESYGPEVIGLWGHWAADNGCYAKGDRFDADAWLRWLGRQRTDTCLFAVAPDVMGDAEATWARALPFFPVLRGLGYHPALVAQDGFDPAAVDWDQFDVLFIGGSTDFKLSPLAEAAIKEAKAHDKSVHVGRVNSRKRFQLMQQWGADSADGNFLAFGPLVNIPRLMKWF